MVRPDCGHRWSRSELLALIALRVAIWTIAAGYLLIEGLEAFSNRQILNLAIFATLYALATYQYSTARYCFAMGRRSLSASAYRASNRMFLASLMAIGDAAQDALAIPLQATTQGAWWLPGLYGLGLIFNLVAVVLAVWSLELHLPIVLMASKITSLSQD